MERSIQVIKNRWFSKPVLQKQNFVLDSKVIHLNKTFGREENLIYLRDKALGFVLFDALNNNFIFAGSEGYVELPVITDVKKAIIEKHIGVIFTNFCTKNCSYCFFRENLKNRYNSSYKKILESLLKIKNIVQIKSIYLTGGDPLDDPYFYDFFSSLLDLFPNLRIEVATRNLRNILKYSHLFKKPNVNVKISLELEDLNRNRFFNELADIANSLKKKVNLITVVNNLNFCQVKNLYSFLEQENCINNLRILPVSPRPWANVKLPNLNEFTSFSRNLLNIALSLNKLHKISFSHFLTFHPLGCPVLAQSKIIINSEGKLIPCFELPTYEIPLDNNLEYYKRLSKKFLAKEANICRWNNIITICPLEQRYQSLAHINLWIKYEFKIIIEFLKNRLL